MKKGILKKIRHIAEKLPTQTYLSSYEPVSISGKDVLLSGTKEINDVPVDIDGEYIVKTPLIRDVNHIRRLKEAYKKNARAGVIAYCRPYIIPEKFGVFQVNLMRFLQ